MSQDSRKSPWAKPEDYVPPQDDEKSKLKELQTEEDKLKKSIFNLIKDVLSPEKTPFSPEGNSSLNDMIETLYRDPAEVKRYAELAAINEAIFQETLKCYKRENTERYWFSLMTELENWRKSFDLYRVICKRNRKHPNGSI